MGCILCTFAMVPRKAYMNKLSVNFMSSRQGGIINQTEAKTGRFKVKVILAVYSREKKALLCLFSDHRWGVSKQELSILDLYLCWVYFSRHQLINVCPYHVMQYA